MTAVGWPSKAKGGLEITKAALPNHLRAQFFPFTKNAAYFEACHLIFPTLSRQMLLARLKRNFSSHGALASLSLALWYFFNTVIFRLALTFCIVVNEGPVIVLPLGDMAPGPCQWIQLFLASVAHILLKRYAFSFLQKVLRCYDMSL